MMIIRTMFAAVNLNGKPKVSFMLNGGCCLKASITGFDRYNSISVLILNVRCLDVRSALNLKVLIFKRPSFEELNFDF